MIITAAIVTAIVEGVKRTFSLTGRVNFVLSLFFGIVLTVFVTVAQADESLELLTIVDGLLVGLAGSGFYSGSKQITNSSSKVV